MNTEVKWELRYKNYRKVIALLYEAVKLETYSNLELQGLIKCFEYTIELAWKTLRDILKAKGYQDVSGPRAVLKKAFSDGYPVDDEAWLTMWEARTITAHTYDEVAANETAVMIKNKY